MQRTLVLITSASLLCLAASATQAQEPMAKPFDPPQKTEWTPEGCRAVPADDPILPSRAAWRNLHSDEIATDEVSIALAPVFEQDWIAESGQFHTLGPSFDDDGNLYAAPLISYDGSVLISLDPTDGSRRWAIQSNGEPSGAASPMVLEDPDNPGEQIIYLALYDRALAVRPDGTIVWDVPTGLSLNADVWDNITLGTNYLPAFDAIVGLTVDGFIYLLDRQTGAQLLNTPFALPGEKSPVVPSALPPAVQALADLMFRQLVNSPPGGLARFRDILLGNDVEVANMFSSDANQNRLFVAATAPDDADGTVDGVSEFGALYGLDVVPNGSGAEVAVACGRFFAGGSASTPALRADGTRVYFGDNFGKLIAVDSNCQDVWELDIGAQIIGSIGVSSDNEELYAATRTTIFQVFDRGGHGEFGWQSSFDVFENPPGQVEFNLLLVGVGANGLSFHSGVGTILGGVTLPTAMGVGQVDRQTGETRYFAQGREESVAVNNTGPDGATYLGHSPVRHIFARVLFELGLAPPTPPITGGIAKFSPQRLDLLIRDAVCAGEDRAQNAFDNRSVCPDSAVADITQLRELIDQARTVAPRAIAARELTTEEWAKIDEELKKAERKLDPDKLDHLDPASNALRRACDVFE